MYLFVNWNTAEPITGDNIWVPYMPVNEYNPPVVKFWTDSNGSTTGNYECLRILTDSAAGFYGFYYYNTNDDSYIQYSNYDSQFNATGSYFLKFQETPTLANNFCTDNGLPLPPNNTWQILDKYENAPYAWCSAPANASISDLCAATWTIGDIHSMVGTCTYIRAEGVICLSDLVTSFRIGFVSPEEGGLIDNYFDVVDASKTGTARAWKGRTLPQLYLSYNTETECWEFGNTELNETYFRHTSDTPMFITGNWWCIIAGSQGWLEFLDVEVTDEPPAGSGSDSNDNESGNTGENNAILVKYSEIR